MFVNKINNELLKELVDEEIKKDKIREDIAELISIMAKKNPKFIDELYEEIVPDDWVPPMIN